MVAPHWTTALPICAAADRWSANTITSAINRTTGRRILARIDTGVFQKTHNASIFARSKTIRRGVYYLRDTFNAASIADSRALRSAFCVLRFAFCVLPPKFLDLPLLLLHRRCRRQPRIVHPAHVPFGIRERHLRSQRHRSLRGGTRAPRVIRYWLMLMMV